MLWLTITAVRSAVKSACRAPKMVKAPVLVAVPPRVVTDTSLTPVVAEPLMVMLAVIRVALSTLKLLTVIPEPKLTEVVPVK